MNPPTTTSPVLNNPGLLPDAPLHAQVFHVRCNRCCATTSFDINSDAVRIICPSCNRRITLPATLKTTCPVCHTTSEYKHTFAGHSTTCSNCGHVMVLDAILGKAEASHHRPIVNAPGTVIHHRRHSATHHTFAFSEGAERSLILLAAAIATLIFVLAASMR